MEDTDFTLPLMQAFQQDCVVKQLQLALRPILAPLEEALKQSNEINAALRLHIAERDDTIQRLTQQVSDLEVRYDDLEQQGRKGSLRVFGLPEDDEGTLEDKLIKLWNNHLELDPPITIEDIEVTHRLGKPPQTNQDGQEASEDGSRQHPKPRPVIVKLASRCTKNAIIEKRKKLKDNPYKCANETTAAVYIGDDLTKRRANLAFQARQLRKNKLIYDTWVTNCKIVVKDNYNRISLIQSEEHIKKFKWRSKTINGNLQQP